MTRRGWVLFIALGVIWGVPYLLIKVAVRDLTPATLVFLRTALGAALLLPVVVGRGNVGALLARWRPIVLFTIVEMAIPWLLLSHAERRVTGSLAGLFMASVPLIGAVLSRVTGRHEPLGARRVFGLVLGLAGVVALLGSTSGEATGLRSWARDRGDRICRRPDDHLAEAVGRSRARRGGIARALRDRLCASRGASAPGHDAGIGSDRRRVGARDRVHCDRVPAVLPADRGGGSGAGDGHHLRDPAVAVAAGVALLGSRSRSEPAPGSSSSSRGPGSRPAQRRCGPWRERPGELRWSRGTQG